MTERDPEIIREFLGEEICESLPQSFPALYERIVYIILKFLQTEDKVLFLQFPIEELSNKVNKMEQYWDEICDVIAYAIRLSMKSGKLQASELSYPGDWYKQGDNFLLLCNEETKWPYFFLKTKSDKYNDKSIRLDFEYPDFRPDKISVKRDYIQNAKAIFELAKMPGQINNGAAKCREEIELLKCGRFNNDHLSSAVAICPAYKRSLPHAGTYIKPVVRIERNKTNYPDSDILAIVGDKAFELLQVAINGLVPDGFTQKLLVFGTQPTVPLIESKPVTITLSFREMHTYCAPKKVDYFEPEFIEINFPWLNDVLDALKNILESHRDQLEDIISKHIYNLTRSMLADIEFSKEKLERFKEYFVKFLEDRIEENEAPELYNKIMVWLNNLSYEKSFSPKQAYANKECAKVILSDRSIHKQLMGMESYGSFFVLDSPCHDCRGENNPISIVMRYHLFPRLRCLYYTDIETPIMNRAKSNIKNDPFFSANVSLIYSHTEASGIVKLEDYFDLDTYQRDFYSLVYGGERVSFTDGYREQLSGDVILSMNDGSLKRIPVTNMMEKEGKTIIFYSQNNKNREVFNHLVNGYYDFPEGKDVDYYVELWQKALKKLVEQTPKKELETLCKELRITKAVLSKHIKGKSKFMNKNKFIIVLDILSEKGLIGNDESAFVKGAQNFYNSSSISFGSRLKDGLYHFRIDENDKSDFLIKLEQRTGYSAAELANEFLYTKTIKEE